MGAVEMTAVIDASHEKLGEWVYAYIVILKAELQVDEESPIRCSKGQLAAYEYPCRIIIHESLPMTATRKILQRELTEEMTPEV
ncbi:AMP-binding enzyme [Vibrio gelatinilyticus]